MADRTSQFTTRRGVLGGAVLGVVTLAGCSGSGSPSQEATTSSTPTTSPDPEFELREVTSDGVARQGGTFTASATIANIGDVDGTASVTFSFEEQSLVEEISLSPGEARPLSVDIEVTQLDPARYELVAEGPDRRMSTFIDVFSAELEPGLHGSVVSEADVSLAGSRLDMTPRKGEKYANPEGVSLGTDGRFALDHPFEPPYDAVAIYLIKESFGDHNGIPAVVDLETDYRVEESGVLLGQYAIPRAYRTEIQLVDTNGDPLSNFAAVNFRAQSGVGLGPRSFTTTDDGYVQAADSAETGISLPSQGAGELLVELQPGGQSRPVRLGTAYGSDAGEEFTFEVENPEQFR